MTSTPDFREFVYPPSFGFADGRRPPGFEKVGQTLVDLIQAFDAFAAGRERLPGNFAAFHPDTPGVIIRDGGIVIDATAEDGDGQSLLAELTSLGLEHGSAFGPVVSGLFPIDRLGRLGDAPTLKFANVAQALVHQGTASSQGDAAIQGDDARGMFGVDGSGVTVGILSDSFDRKHGSSTSGKDYDLDRSSGDLPANVQILDDSLPMGTGSDEGRAIGQIIHDVAPGADLAFHTAFNGKANFANGILDLAHSGGADVIVDDVLYVDEPMFMDGIVAQAVDRVAQEGVSYFSAAGNESRRSYESGYSPAEVPNVGLSWRYNSAHDFDPGPGVDTLRAFSIPAGKSVLISFQWADPYFSVTGTVGAATDLDMFILDSRGKIVAASTDANIGADPVEILSFKNSSTTTQNYDLLIAKWDGPDPQRIKYVDFLSGSGGLFNGAGSSYGHASAEGGEGVGAAHYGQTPVFGTAPPVIESFSAAGGTPILFDAHGKHLPTPEMRERVDIVAPDGGDTTFFGKDTDGNGLPNFLGTSAAAPHAAAIAALIKQLDPGATPQEIYSALERTAIDMDDPRTAAFDAGYDQRTGHGLINAVDALGEFHSPPSSSVVMAELGVVPGLTNVPQTITLTHDFIDPVVIAQPASINGGDQAVVRLVDVDASGTKDSLRLQLVEPSNLDGTHIKEQVSFLVIEKGAWQLADGTLIEAGEVDSGTLGTATFKAVPFRAGFEDAPLVLSQAQTSNEAGWLVTRERNISDQGFGITIQEEEASMKGGGTHATESLGWLAMEPGHGSWDGNTYSAGSRDGVHQTYDRLDFGTLFSSAPNLLAGIASYAGSDPAGLRLNNLGPNSADIKVEEDTSFDSEVGHYGETVHYLAIEGDGLLTAHPIVTA